MCWLEGPRATETRANRRTGPIWVLRNTWTVIQTWVDANRQDATRRKSNETIFLCARRRPVSMHTNDPLRAELETGAACALGNGLEFRVDTKRQDRSKHWHFVNRSDPPYRWSAQSETNFRWGGAPAARECLRRASHAAPWCCEQ